MNQMSNEPIVNVQASIQAPIQALINVNVK